MTMLKNILVNELYALRSKVLLSKEEISEMQKRAEKRYFIGSAIWLDEESLAKSGWHYKLSCEQDQRLMLEDFDMFKKKGLTFLLTQDQAEKFTHGIALISLQTLNYPIEVIAADKILEGTGGNL